MNNFIDHVLSDKTKIYRIWVYRRMFKPREQEEKFIDETFYECSQCETVCICEAYELPDKDILLGVRSVIDSEDMNKPQAEWDITYYKLSEIRLAYYPFDKVEVESW